MLWARLVALFSGATRVVLASHRLLAKLGGSRAAGTFRIPLEVLALLIAGGLCLVGATCFSALSHAVVQAKALGPISKFARVFELSFPVYRFLFAEVLARFPGTANRRWYLTDGGHSENSGCYELIRRRVEFIVCCDSGADPERKLGDLANLVRMARVDFGAHVTFLDRERLRNVLPVAVAPFVAELEQLQKAATAPVYASLAEIRYDRPEFDGQRSWLLWIKPSVTGREPVDVLHYGVEHPDFPQQSTGDQSFDDAQWEAYRQLGDHIGQRLFANGAGAAVTEWHPARLDAAGFAALASSLPLTPFAGHVAGGPGDDTAQSRVPGTKK